MCRVNDFHPSLGSHISETDGPWTVAAPRSKRGGKRGGLGAGAGAGGKGGSAGGGDGGDKAGGGGGAVVVGVHCEQDLKPASESNMVAASRQPVVARDWSVAQVVAWVASLHSLLGAEMAAAVAALCAEEEIDGEALLTYTRADLKSDLRLKGGVLTKLWNAIGQLRGLPAGRADAEEASPVYGRASIGID
jgi:hypothetical protein